jgi:hypothetical protein
MLSGLQGVSGSMFRHLGVGDEHPFFRPDPEDMERAAEAVRFNKTVNFKSYNVRTFDTSTPKQRKEYATLMLELHKGIQASTHVVWYHDRKFVETDKGPRWLVHIEWAEFELKVEPVAPIGAAPDSGDDDG